MPMFFYEGQKCPVCGRPFGEQDDVVTCPECGAPHHRECWKQEGTCHFAHLHGTGRSWEDELPTEAAPKTTKTCPRCGAGNPEFAEFCARCGLEFRTAESTQPKPNIVTDTPSAPPVGSASYTPLHQSLQDPYGGVSREETIGDVPVDTIAEIVGANSAYYLPRFYRMTHGGSKVSWNWSAFLLPYNWLLYRKNVLFGFVAFVFLSILNLITNFTYAQLEPLLESGALYEFMLQPTTDLLLSQSGIFLTVFSIATMVTVAIRVLLGLFGNYLYLQTVLRKARKLGDRETSPYDSTARRSGGTSFILAILPDLIVLVLGYVAMTALSMFTGV